MATYSLLDKTGLTTLLTKLKTHVLANISDQVSAQDTKITNLTNTVSTLNQTVSAQDTKITNLTNTVNNLIAAITDAEIEAAVNAVWPE